LHLSIENAKIFGDYSELKNHLSNSLDYFNRYEEKIPYLNLLVKMIIMLEQYGATEQSYTIYVTEDDSIDWEKVEFIHTDFMWLFSDWDRLEGPRLLEEAQLSEDDVYAQLTEFEWEQDDKNGAWIEDSDVDDLVLVFRAIRNSFVKSIRLGIPVLSSDKWIERIEII
jgi:hypothetical protein